MIVRTFVEEKIKLAPGTYPVTEPACKIINLFPVPHPFFLFTLFTKSSCQDFDPLQFQNINVSSKNTIFRTNFLKINTKNNSNYSLNFK